MNASVIDPFDVTSDTSMPCLAAALDPVEVQSQFQRRLKSLVSDGGHVDVRSIRVVRHKPQRRCVIEYHLVVEGPGHSAEDVVLIGKVRARRFGKSGYRMLKQLWDAGFSDGSLDGISVPEPIGTVGRFQMWLQRKVPGTVATELWQRASCDTLSLARRLAEAAHKLHQTTIPLGSTHTMQDELRILAERLPFVYQGEPRWTRRIDQILRASVDLAESTPTNRPCVIHRDFYSDQVVVNDDRLYLLDFDLCCVGDPAVDVGNMLGHLTEQSLRTWNDPNALRPAEDALLNRFVELAGSEMRAAAQAYAVLTLVRHVYLSTLFPDRRGLTESMIDLCEDRLTHRVQDGGP